MTSIKPHLNNNTTIIRRLKIKLFSLCACVDKLSIHDSIPPPRVYDLNAHWKEEALAAVTELRANGVLAGSADMYRVSVALLVDGTGDAEGVVSQNLRVYRSFRGHFAEATDELIAACGLERGAVLDEVPRMAQKQQPDPARTLQERYVSHVNSTAGITEEVLLGLSDRVDTLCDFMCGRNACRIPVLLSGVREYDDWLPHFKTTRFMQEALFIGNEEYCRISMSMLCILQSVEDELRDILDEMRAWRVLQCAMALHRRVGGGSRLGMLGEDVVRLVVKFVVD